MEQVPSSIEMITLSLPGVSGRWRALRLPVACIGREWMMKALRNRDWKRNAPSQFHLCRYCGAFNFLIRWRNAVAHIRRLVCVCGLVFAVPVAKHTARKQRASGERRKEATTGRPTTSIKALLVQVTGDWKAFKNVFRFPERDGCCWMC